VQFTAWRLCHYSGINVFFAEAQRADRPCVIPLGHRCEIFSIGFMTLCGALSSVNRSSEDFISPARQSALTFI
jgi:hypothetical protein